MRRGAGAKSSSLRRQLFVTLFTGASVAMFHAPVYGQIAFEEVTVTAGLTRSGESWGSAWGDLNGDEYPDLYSNNHRGPPSMYANNGNGSFADVAKRTEIDVITKRYRSDKPDRDGLWTGDNHGAAWADVDNDGYQDLVQLNGGAIGGSCSWEHCGTQFYFNVENLGTSVGRELAAQNDMFDAGLRPGRGRSPAWLDWNGDGRLDLFIANLKRTNPSVPSALFEQTDAGFLHRSNVLGSPREVYQSAHLSDVTGDGRMDLVLLGSIKLGCSPTTCLGYHQIEAYDLSTEPITEVARDLGLSPRPQLARDMIFADFNNDLLPDVYLPSVDAQLGMMISTDLPAVNELFVNTGSGFEQMTAEAGLGVPNACRHGAAGDFDNDGDVDLYVVCGNRISNTANILYENMGSQGGVPQFVPVPGAGGAAGVLLVGSGDTAIVADYDLDGFLDLFVTNGKVPSIGPDQLYRNLGNENHWIEIDLRGAGPSPDQDGSNRDGIGARVILHAGGKSQLREQNGGMHKNAQDSQRLHFGLGESDTITSLIVLWPSGTWQAFSGIPADQVIQVEEAGGWTSVFDGSAL